MNRVRLVKNSGGSSYGVSFDCPGCATVKQHAETWGADHVVPTNGPSAWGFNGDMERPTLTPSILVHSHEAFDKDDNRYTTPRCHSFVTAGRIQFFADCTHALAGQTVDLPDVVDVPA